MCARGYSGAGGMLWGRVGLGTGLPPRVLRIVVFLRVGYQVLAVGAYAVPNEPVGAKGVERDSVLASAAVHGVTGRPIVDVDLVIAILTVDQVVALIALDGVRAVASTDPVGISVSRDPVVAVAAEDGVDDASVPDN